MLFHHKSFSIALTVVALLAAASHPAQASITYQTPSGSLDSSSEPINAQAVFTLGNGTVTIELINLQANPTSAGQLISGLNFNITGSTSSGSLSDVNSGDITYISSGGSYSTITPDSLTRWKAKETGSTVNLSALGGGQPDHLIIGPDNAGDLDGTGKYNKANASIYNFLPVVLGSAYFTIAINGVTTNSVLSNVQFQFGTKPDTTIIGQVVPNAPNPVPVPEPTTVIAGVLLLAPLGLQTLRTLRTNRRRTAV